MDKKKKIIELIVDQGVVPLFFHPDAETSAQILKALYKAGCRVVEFTNRGENAVANFLQLRKITDKELPGLKLGVGTIRNRIEATQFINEGANFILCPGVIEEVAVLAEKNDLLWIPGCMTPTEIILADELGARIIKLFPGNLLGPSYIAAIKEIFPELLFMPTGGIDTNEEDLAGWFKSGAIAVGLGSKLISAELVETKDYQGIESGVRKILEIIQKIHRR
jgi:2-dehydro-3-deoxyphosphogluconate aldolase / (4S)-4-hydroxy-2-oxoglutarate aldolase